MEVLLDTCTLIWFLEANERTPLSVRKIIKEERNGVYVSLASLWEIGIKHNKNPQRMLFSAKEIYDILLRTKVRLLDISAEHVFTLDDVIKQGTHNDPFDHLLLATAKANKLTLLTHDENLKNYKDIDVMVY